MKHVIVALSAVALTAVAGPAVAHGERQVGDVTWTVGWADEPAFVGFENAVELSIDQGGVPVEIGEGALEVTVSLGGQTSDPLDLVAAFASPGSYVADIIPTAPGDYTFRFTGTIAGEEVDESWTASEDDFSQVRSADEIAFPNPAPANSELADRIEAVDAEVESMNTSTPLVLSIVALALAVVALGRGFVGGSGRS